MSLPAWVAQYIGIPYRPDGRSHDGCDCYGLCALVLEERFDCRVPSVEPYPTSPTEQAREAARIAQEWTIWLPKVSTPYEPGDVLLLRMAGLPIHCGIYVGDGRFLHTLHGMNSALERTDSPLWRRRVQMAYRHEDLPHVR